MKDLLKHVKADERGAVQVIEMTLVLPIVLLIMGFLIYAGMYILTTVTIYNNAQFIAMTAAKELTFPGYAQLFPDPGGSQVNMQVDVAASFFEGSPPGLKKSYVKNVFDSKNHNPYRYFQSSGKMLGNNISALENRLSKMVMQSMFLSGAAPVCSVSAEKNMINQKVIVNVKKTFFVPKFVQYLGLTKALTIDVTATATANNPAEFIRTIDLIGDTLDWFMKDTSAGKAISGKIAPYIEKIQSVLKTLGIVG